MWKLVILLYSINYQVICYLNIFFKQRFCFSGFKLGFFLCSNSDYTYLPTINNPKPDNGFQTLENMQQTNLTLERRETQWVWSPWLQEEVSRQQHGREELEQSTNSLNSGNRNWKSGNQGGYNCRAEDQRGGRKLNFFTAL